VAPVFLDLAKTVEKATAVMEEASRHGAQLVVFPEAFIPAFPIWSALQAPIYNHEWFKRLAASSPRCPGPEIAHIAAVARRLGIFVSLGFNELSAVSVGCLWNSNVLINDEGTILNHHRKLVPTFFEKLTWANGDAAGLRVSDTRLGRIGVLICGENTNPLARYTLIAEGEHVHISTYPPVWPTRDPRRGGNYDLAAAIRIRAGAHSFEGKVFNVVASGFLDSSARETLAALSAEAGDILDATPRGISLVIGPTGDPVSEVMAGQEGILYADIDVAACVEPKQFHDVVGYYNRFDVFRLTVDRSENRPIRFADGPGEGPRGGPESPAASRGARGDEAPDREGPAAPDVPRASRR
jgi:predicted amidohydrolase